MSIPHQFGGDWTEHKLQALKKYLEAYMTIFTGNERARYFDTVYVDAFAGTGYRTLTNPQEQELFEELRQDDNQRYLEGSAKIALGIKNRSTNTSSSKRVGNVLESWKNYADSIHNKRLRFTRVTLTKS